MAFLHFVAKPGLKYLTLNLGSRHIAMVNSGLELTVENLLSSEADNSFLMVLTPGVVTHCPLPSDDFRKNNVAAICRYYKRNACICTAGFQC
jgi:hypothetical protein